MTANRCMKHTMNEVASIISIDYPVDKSFVSIRKSMDELFKEFYAGIKGKEMDELREEQLNIILSEVLRGEM